jgi:hypothetical protein
MQKYPTLTSIYPRKDIRAANQHKQKLVGVLFFRSLWRIPRRIRVGGRYASQLADTRPRFAGLRLCRPASHLKRIKVSCRILYHKCGTRLADAPLSVRVRQHPANFACATGSIVLIPYAPTGAKHELNTTQHIRQHGLKPVLSVFFYQPYLIGSRSNIRHPKSSA